MIALQSRVITHLQLIYPEADHQAIAGQIIDALQLPECLTPNQFNSSWDQNDVIVISYADSINNDHHQPLDSLHSFLNDNLKGYVTAVHILPFFPYSSDDGFAVIDYSTVNPAHGNWEHIKAIAEDFKIMADLVINHCSARSHWFENYKSGRQPGLDYFYESSPDQDLSAVVRPRTSPLLYDVETSRGTRHVWCTFSHDQVDFNFNNPQVLIEFVRIVSLYLQQGISIFRLDAVAFIWKEIGTSCINLLQTHEIVRLLRTLIEHYDPNAVLITETNIPNRENLSYFGNSNEAHGIYNFALPPLLLHTLLTGDCSHLKTWMMSMPPAQMGTFFLNFIASHDGIGLRPVEAILSEKEVETLIETMQSFGGHVSWRALKQGQKRPYEINISLFDAMQGTISGEQDQWQVQRFLCAHAIMLALEGIPAIYLHSFLATPNDHDRVRHTGHNRAINRSKLYTDQLIQLLVNAQSNTHQVLNGIKRLIAIRKRQPAFHPNATQFTMHFQPQIFAFWRQSIQREQSIFALNNVSDIRQTISLADINLIEINQWHDLLSGERYNDLQQHITLQPYQTVWITNYIEQQS
ncbi:MAG: sugar phosphorylase [Gammaproteobacteria bacterium]|nr:sugar phosphorylase [Gammaproteobacteria bacterium]